MSNFKNDFSKNIKLNINKDLIDKGSFRNPMNDIFNSTMRQNEKTMRAIEESRIRKEQEELRRHNELIEALKTAGENGATIVVGDNNNSVQIQQNTSGSTQHIENNESFDFDKIHSILKEIEGYFNFPQFDETFKDNTDTVKSIIYETINAAESKTNPSLIKKSLKTLKDLTIGVSGSLIGSGILGLITSTGVC